jgi:hypothetical protein
VDLSPAWLVSSLCVGSVGVGLFVYGRKQARLPQFLAGVALLAESSFVPSVAWMLALAAVILVALWGALRTGA